MYTAYADGICIYSPVGNTDAVKLVDPKLTLSDNAAGSFEFTMPPENAGYSSITRLSSRIVVKEDGAPIWEGRVISDSVDFWNYRKVFAEGALAYLNDTIQPQAKYENITPEAFLYNLMGIHNYYAGSDQQFWVDAVDITTPGTFITNYETTKDTLMAQLVDKFGGHVYLTYNSNGNRYLNYTEAFPRTNTQEIRFGENLIDFTRSWDATEYATVILPLGASLDESPIDDLTAYVTVKSVNGGSEYVVNSAAVATYGWVAKVVRFDDISDPYELLLKAQAYLADQQFDTMTLEMTAADLHGLDADVEAFRLLDLVRCISVPHGMNRYFPITKMEIALDSPESTVFTLGAKPTVSLTATSW